MEVFFPFHILCSALKRESAGIQDTTDMTSVNLLLDLPNSLNIVETAGIVTKACYFFNASNEVTEIHTNHCLNCTHILSIDPNLSQTSVLCVGFFCFFKCQYPCQSVYVWKCVYFSILYL